MNSFIFCRTIVTLLLIVRLRTAVFHEAKVSINWSVPLVTTLLLVICALQISLMLYMVGGFRSETLLALLV